MAAEGTTYPDDFELLLASRSPRRTMLLTAAGVPHRVVESRGGEASQSDDPLAVARDHALEKVRGAVVPADAGPRAFVLGSDTVVVADGTVLGKPADSQEAVRMLTELSGRRHQVVSGVALLRMDLPDAPAVGTAATSVDVRPLRDEEIEVYVASGEWADKAGGYAIQGRGALLVEGIEGDYANVVGLPLGLLRALVGRLGFDLLTGSWRQD